jgi:hypothetical protein
MCLWCGKFAAYFAESEMADGKEYACEDHRPNEWAWLPIVKERSKVEKTIEIQFKELREKIANDVAASCVAKEHSVHIDWQTKQRLMCSVCQEICDIIIAGVPYERI